MGETGEEADLIPTSGSVAFAPGQASKRLELTVVADQVSFLYRGIREACSPVHGTLELIVFPRLVHVPQLAILHR